jgi:hypothetical protein
MDGGVNLQKSILLYRFSAMAVWLQHPQEKPGRLDLDQGESPIQGRAAA